MARSCWISRAADCSRGIAQLVFERAEGDVERSYDGAFADEFDNGGAD